MTGTRPEDLTIGVSSSHRDTTRTTGALPARTTLAAEGVRPGALSRTIRVLPVTGGYLLPRVLTLCADPSFVGCGLLPAYRAPPQHNPKTQPSRGRLAIRFRLDSHAHSRSKAYPSATQSTKNTILGPTTTGITWRSCTTYPGVRVLRPAHPCDEKARPLTVSGSTDDWHPFADTLLPTAPVAEPHAIPLA